MPSNSPTERVPWIERRFHLQSDPRNACEVIERLRGAIARARELVSGLPPEMLSAHPDDGWSMQQNLGHLADLEPLGERRIDEILAGVASFSPADLSNAATAGAGHDDRLIDSVLGSFEQQRTAICDRVAALDGPVFARSCRHERLGIPMRLVDLLEFMCCHDDYHLARMRSLRRHLTGDP